MHGVRARLTVTLVALVALTAILLGVGSYVFVDRTLHQQFLDAAAAQARFDLSVTVPDAGLPPEPGPDDIADSLLLQTFQRRGVEAVVDLGEEGAAISNDALGEAQAVLDGLPTDLTDAGSRRSARLCLDDGRRPAEPGRGRAGPAIRARPST